MRKKGHWQPAYGMDQVDEHDQGNAEPVSLKLQALTKTAAE